MNQPEHISRRELLRRGVGALAATGLATAGGFWLYDPHGDAGLPDPKASTLRLKNYFAKIDFPVSNPRISVATSGATNVEGMVRAAVGGLDPALGVRRFIEAGDVVLIKPNVGFDRAPRLGATTNPEVLRWVIRLCKDAGAAQIVVADNPIESPEACFAKSKIDEVTKQEGARLILPARTRFQQLVIRDRAPIAANGEALGRWPIFYEPLARADKVIGVTPVKDHNLCSASITMKNWYGLLGGRRNQFHQAIHNIVSDLGMMMSPTLVIADGTRVMMKNGPTGGRTSDVEPGGELHRPVIVASVDPVACDAWCYRNLLGRDPALLAYLDMAHQKILAQVQAGHRRFGERDVQKYKTQGRIVMVDV